MIGPSLLNLLYILFGYMSLHGLVLSVLMYKKYGRGVADYLVIIAGLFSSLIVLSLFFWTGNYEWVPKVLRFPTLIVFLFGPLFLGLQKDIKLIRMFQGARLLHFVPFIVWYILLLTDLVFRYNVLFHVGMATHIFSYALWNTLIFRMHPKTSGRKVTFFCYLGFSLLYLIYEIIILNQSWNVYLDYFICLLMSALILTLMIKSYFNYDFRADFRLKRSTSEAISEDINRVALYHLREKKNFLNGSYKLTDLANDSGLPVNLLSEALNAEYGGYYRLIHNLRIKHAKALLKNTDKQVIEIAFSSGFNNKVSFYNIFKNETGMTPLQWREKVKNEEKALEA